MAILGYNTIGGSSISNADTIHISSLVPVISSKISHGTNDNLDPIAQAGGACRVPVAQAACRVLGANFP